MDREASGAKGDCGSAAALPWSASPAYFPSASSSQAHWTPLEFARLLHREAPWHFETTDAALESIRATEVKLRVAGVQMLRPCSFAQNGGTCWALRHSESWNDALNHHGPELLVEPGGRTLLLRTLYLPWRATLKPEETLTSACLVLWLLYEHRCITSAKLNAGVIAPHHVSLFYRLLRFHTGYVSVGVQADHVEPGGDWRCRVFDALQATTHLHTLHLSALRLNEPQSDRLCDVITRNPSLSVLVLRDVTVDLAAAVNIFSGLTFLKALEELQFEATVDDEQDAYAEAVTILLHTTVRKLKLRLACDMSEFFLQLGDNHTLQELELSHPVSDSQCLTSLATSLGTNRVLSRLKMIVNFSRERACDFYKALASIVAKNRRLEVLDLSGSTFHGDLAMYALSDSLRHNYTLDEVYLHDCGLTCDDVMRLLDGLSGNASVRELCFGAVNDTPATRAMILNRDVLLTRTTFVWADDEVLILAEHLFNLALRKFFLRAQDGWPEDVGRLLDLVPSFRHSLTTLYIDAPGTITAQAAVCLSSLFELSRVLRKVAVFYDTEVESSLALLEGLTSSTSITVFAFGRWHLGGMVSTAFRTALMSNRSLLQLDFHRFEGECVHPELFDENFVDAVSTSASLVAVRRFRNGREVWDQPLHAGKQAALRRNETALRHTIDVILRERLLAPASYAYHKLRSCDAQGSYFSDCGVGWTTCPTLQELYDAVRHPLRGFSLQFDSLLDEVPERDSYKEFQDLYDKCRRQIDN